MSERDTTPDKAQETSAGDEMRPLPDGGLTEGLPDWLRRPPAWRDLPRKDNDPGTVLPEPDTSVIDPRTFVDVSDLPSWLQAIAARGEEPALSDPEHADTAEQEETTMQPDDQNVAGAPESNERDVAFEPVDKKKWDIPDEETKTYGGGPPKQPNMLLIGAAVLVLLIILLIIIAIIL